MLRGGLSFLCSVALLVGAGQAAAWVLLIRSAFSQRIVPWLSDTLTSRF